MSGNDMRIETLDDPAALARHVAEWMTAAALATEGAKLVVVGDSHHLGAPQVEADPKRVLPCIRHELICH